MRIREGTDRRKKPVWIVDYYVLGKQKRKQFRRDPNVPKEQDLGYEAACKYAKDMEKKIYRQGPQLASLSETVLRDLLHLYGIITEAGLTIRQAEQILLQSEVLVSMTKTVAKVIEEYLKAKEGRLGNGIRPRTLKQYRYVLRRFKKTFGDMPIRRVSAAQIEDWLQQGWNAARTKRSVLTDIKSFFGYAVRHEHVLKNPCTKLEPIHVPAKPPGILTPRQAAKLMRVAYRHDRRFCPALALMLFCGIRPEEIAKLTWENIRLEQCLVEVTAQASKTSRRRLVKIPPNAVEWLKLGGDLATVRASGRDLRGKIKLQPPVNIKERFDRIRRKAGLFKNWPHDAMRHSAATYLYALTDDASYVAKQMGHTVAVLLMHYQSIRTPNGELVTKELALLYFAIVPPK